MAQRLSGLDSKTSANRPRLTGRLLSEKRKNSPERQMQLNPMLVDAARKGKLKRAGRLLNLGADANSRLEERGSRANGWTALMLAASRGDTGTCALLIGNGADVNARIEKEIYKHKTALMLAANEGHTETCRLLIGNGADVNARDDNTRTVLMEAVYGNRLETCKLLIRKGADINAKFEEGKYGGWTALMRATDLGNVKIAEFLKMMESFSKTMGRDSFRPFMLNFDICTQ
jgi:ankyrin repeat protein